MKRSLLTEDNFDLETVLNEKLMSPTAEELCAKMKSRKKTDEQTKEEKQATVKFAHEFSILEANHVWLSSMPKTQLYKRNAADALLLFEQVDQFVHEMLPPREIFKPEKETTLSKGEPLQSALPPEFINPSRIANPQMQPLRSQATSPGIPRSLRMDEDVSLRLKK